MKFTSLLRKRAVFAVLLTLLLSAAGVTKARAQSFTVGDLNYTLNGNAATVTGHVDGTAATGTLTIPETVTYNGNDYPVTAIGNSAFPWAGFTGDLVIPNSVTSIGYSAFYECTGFDGILTIGNSVTTINGDAFRGCTGFTGDLAIPNSVTTIGNYAFLGCNSFNGNLSFGNSVTSIGEYAFNGCSGFTGSLTLPDTLTSLGIYAFCGCSGFNGTLTLGGALTSIGRDTFNGCSGFTGTLVIPNTVSSIGQSAFYNCGGFTGDLTLPEGLTSIGGAAFSGCSGFDGILTIPTTVTSIAGGAFDNLTNLSEIHYNATNCNNCSDYYGGQFYNTTGTLVIGEGVQRMPNFVFLNANGLTGELVLPESLTYLGQGAFKGCSGLTGDLIIPSSVTTLGSSAFEGCSGFHGILSMPEGLTSIGGYTFSGCSGLTGDLTIPSTVTSIGQYAFSGCSGLNGELTLGENVTSFGNAAFSGCTGLTGSPSIVVTGTIGSGVFSGCSSLTGEITIGEAVTSIGSDAFTNCSGMTAVHYNAVNCAAPQYYGYNWYCSFEGCGGVLTIGENVERIPDAMFRNSAFTIENLVIPNSVTSIGGLSFYHCTGLTGDLTIGDGVTSIGDEAFSGCTGFTGDLTIGPNVSTIGGYAFNGCTGFAGELTLTHELTSLGSCAFASCTGLTGSPDIVLTGTIGERAFDGCSSLTGEITIGEGVTSIGAYAFTNCSGMTAVHYNAVNCAAPQYYAYNWSCSFIGCGGVLTIGENVERIPDAMFRNSAFTGSLIIPNSVTTIAQLAFYNCTGLTDIRPKSVTPPTLSASAFDNVDHTIPVYVPCGTTEDYQAASGWSAFTNYEEVTSDITVATNNALFGTASIVNHGDCENTESIVLAEPYQGCVFVNWTVNGEEVSTDAEYTFALAGDVDLVANFEIAPNCYIFVGGADNNLWSSAANWMPNEVPAEANVVAIRSNVKVDVEASAADVYFYGNITMTIKPEGNLMVEGTFNPDGDYNLIIEEGGQFWHATDGIVATMTKAIEHYTNDNNGWYLISLPTAGNFATYYVQNLTSHNFDFYRYDEPTGYWKNYLQNGFSFEPGHGYLYANDYDVTLGFTGTLKNGTAEVNVPLSYTEGIELEGFNLVGNPFAHNVTSYAAENVAEGCFRPNEDRDDLMVSEISEENPLHPLEGFFVKAVADNASVTFNAQRGAVVENGAIRVEVADNGTILDRLIMKPFSRGLEKISINQERTKLFAVKDNHEMAIVPCVGNEQPVSFKAAKNGTYTLSVNTDELQCSYLHLIDNLTGTDVDLLASPSYTFEAQTTDYASRFKIVFDGSFIFGDEEGDVFAFYDGSGWVIGNEGRATVQVVDLTGRILSSEQIEGSASVNVNAAPGLYMLRLINGDNVKVQKVVVR